MQVTSRTALRTVGDVQLPTAPCYLIRCGVDTGLQWLAAARNEWQLPDGRPSAYAIASAAGMSGGHVFRLKSTPAIPPGNKTMACLVKIAAAAYGVPCSTAQERLFWFYDPDNADDVEQLAAYLEAATEARAA